MFPGLSLLFVVAGLTFTPYVPPVLEPEPAFLRSAVSVVEIVPANGDWDTNVFARPLYSAPLVGHVARGARLRVRGELRPEDPSYCASGMYYALEPFGWICSTDAQPTNQPVTTQSVLQIVPGTNVPYRYVMVVVPEGEYLPMWDSIEDLWQYNDPTRQLGRGDTVALSDTIEQFEDESYYITVDGKVLPVKGTSSMKAYSEWQGEPITAATHLPFGWVTPQKAPVYDAPRGKKIDELERRTRIDTIGEQQIGSQRWLEIGEGRFIKADHLNEVRRLERPIETNQHPQWIDVDLGEQVVVAYVNDQPVYATLTSSGKDPNNTPRGNYPIWGKASAITMKSQQYDDSPYYVNRVPWVLFFQAHNALHGAYWHDRFGVTKSHGCANLSPRDARYLFEWLDPTLPSGWTAVHYWDLTKAPVAHVRNSRRVKQITQERKIGPPDKDDEAERLEQAVARREAEERERAAQLQVQSAAILQVAPAMPTPLGNRRAPQVLPSPLLR